MTIHILEYIKLPKDLPRSNSLRDSRELVWIHRLNTFIPSGLNIYGLKYQIQDELKSIKKRQPAFATNIIHVQGLLPMSGTPLNTLNFG